MSEVPGGYDPRAFDGFYDWLGGGKMSELKACPGCGAAASPHFYLDGENWFAKCDRCGRRTGNWLTAEAAIVSWNMERPIEEVKMSELKACPFCGLERSEAVSYTVAEEGRWMVQCLTCGARTGANTTQKDAIEAWNRRLPEQGPQLLRQSLKAISEIAIKRGWNGVENSKILEEFIETEFSAADQRIAALKAAEAPAARESLIGAAVRERNRGDALGLELQAAKDLIYRLALKVM